MPIMICPFFKKCVAAINYSARWIVFNKHSVIVRGEADELTHTPNGSNTNHLGHIKRSEEHHAMLNNNTRHGNNTTHFTTKQHKVFVVPEFYRKLKGKVRGHTPNMLQAVKEYCQKDIGNNSHIRHVNKYYGGRMYFDIFHGFVYCQINKV